jgi:hypothetical protein
MKDLLLCLSVGRESGRAAILKAYDAPLVNHYY